MASVFTYDPDPPRVSSPWLASTRHESSDSHEHPAQSQHPDLASPENSPLTRLEAEPQAGPTEYKLHLLLRPRRTFSYTSTGRRYIGLYCSKLGPALPKSISESPAPVSPLPAQPGTGRQHRLERLTTQLLWRLQQSSPYHSSSSNSLILPTLPAAAPELAAPKTRAKLLPGLEESRGALYEIGVADNGSFAGLTKDEMDESLGNLRAMAASLGCSVRILRMVAVGECEWHEPSPDPMTPQTALHREELFVAEAYVKPELQENLPSSKMRVSAEQPTSINATMPQPEAEVYSRDGKHQLRVSLTGASTSGKSSLLGTLSTSTLDNGRGKSRLSLLKHRHEIASGMTSSVAQELIGYSVQHVGGEAEPVAQVINYATGNVSSWNDIHASSEHGRLAFVSDSAGHPRFRRTTVRGLVGWAPHWTFLCVAANGGQVAPGRSQDTSRGSDDEDNTHDVVSVSLAHLRLCLSLNVPLVIVITKLDTATKTTFRHVLSDVLSHVKQAGKKPVMLSNDNAEITESDLHFIPAAYMEEVQKVVADLSQAPLETVPIVFTSAVKGSGIAKLHALLRQLPLDSRQSVQINSNARYAPDFNDDNVKFLVDDMFTRPLAKFEDVQVGDAATSGSMIVSGHLAHGRLSVGDEMYLGPFVRTITKTEISTEPVVFSTHMQESFLSPRTFTAALAKATMLSNDDSLPLHQEWKKVSIISARNLRLPVKTLETDQVGTLGIVFEEPLMKEYTVRKGMLLSRHCESAARTFTASFGMDDANSVVVGTLIIAYCGTLRAPAKVIAVTLAQDETVEGEESDSGHSRVSDNDLLFAMDSAAEPAAKAAEEKKILVTFKFIKRREWLEKGSQVLVMAAGGPGFPIKGVPHKSGSMHELEGLVGGVVETFR